MLDVLKAERAMTVVNTGTVAMQYREENFLMTIMMQGHDARQLNGRALITLDRVTVWVDDETWAEVVGRMVCLEGGTELDVDDARLGRVLKDYDLRTDGPLTPDTFIPVVVRDIYMPPCRALVRWGDLMHRVNIIEPGDGVRASGKRVECKSACGGCVACYYARWQAKARAMGMVTE